MAALFYKAPFIGELAAEGGLRGCFFIFGKRRATSQSALFPGFRQDCRMNVSASMRGPVYFIVCSTEFVVCRENLQT